MNDKLEFMQDVLNFINEIGQYNNFMSWMEERGFDVEEVERIWEKIESGEH